MWISLFCVVFVEVVGHKYAVLCYVHVALVSIKSGEQCVSISVVYVIFILADYGFLLLQIIYIITMTLAYIINVH